MDPRYIFASPARHFLHFTIIVLCLLCSEYLGLDDIHVENVPVSFVRVGQSGAAFPANTSDVEFTTESLDDAIKKQEATEARSGQASTSSLSRRRRYLIFPEGSSLQVVFCLTYLTNIDISDIFYMGATASLAWELPQDPYSPFEHHAEALHRKDEGPLVYKDIKGSQKLSGWGNRILVNKLTGKPIQPFAKDYYNNRQHNYNKIPHPQKNYKTKELSEKRSKQSHRRKIIVNPVFAKRSADEKEETQKTTRVKKKRASVLAIDREAMHEEQNDRKHLAVEYMNPENVEFHRLSRRGLYEKIEKLILGMGFHGRECVLKALCEMGQDREGKQGSFLEEIMRVIFTLPQGKQFEDDNHQAYDEAHNNGRNCTEMYQECSFSIKSLPLM